MSSVGAKVNCKKTPPSKMTNSIQSNHYSSISPWLASAVFLQIYELFRLLPYLTFAASKALLAGSLRASGGLC